MDLCANHPQQNFKIGHVTLTTPLSGMIFSSAMVCTKFEAFTCTRYEGMKSGAKCKNGVVWGVRSHSRSSALSPFDSTHFLINFNKNYASLSLAVFEIYRVIFRK